MATLGDLKTRVADELTRDDMTSGGDSYNALVTAINSAIDQTSNELFWFNRSTATVSTTGGSNRISLPSGMKIATQVSYLEYELIHDDLLNIEALTETGVPSRWAMDGDNIYLWPQPDQAYSLSIQGTANVGTPASDTASNVWTTEAYDLIAARVKVRLCRFPFRDPDGMMMAKDEEAEALSVLRHETRRRGKVPARIRDMTTRRYNINTDR